MATEAERLATVEAVLQDVREDVGEIKTETRRTRDRLHKLEGGMSLLLTRDSVTKEMLGERNRHIDRRIQLLIGIAAVGAILEPLLNHFVTGG